MPTEEFTAVSPFVPAARDMKYMVFSEESVSGFSLEMIVSLSSSSSGAKDMSMPWKLKVYMPSSIENVSIPAHLPLAGVSAQRAAGRLLTYAPSVSDVT